MKKIFLTSLCLIVFGLLSFVNSATATSYLPEEFNLLPVDITTPVEKPTENILIKIVSINTEQAISGEIQLIVELSREKIAESEAIPVEGPLSLIGKISLLGSDKSITIGEKQCEIKSECLISSFDTKEVSNGKYELTVTDSDNKYSSDSIVISIENPIITYPNPPVNGGSDTTTPRRRSSSGSYLTNFSNNQEVGRVLGAEKFIFTLLLKQGSRGNEVTELHKRLIADGYLKITAPTGYFGPLTLKAVKEFQTAKGLNADGVVGPLTRAELNK